MFSIHPVILSGGSGARLWPLSREAYPKQFLRLLDQYSLFMRTCKRIHRTGYSKPTILAGEDHRFIVAEQLRELSIEPKQIILEPAKRNTASAILIAALSAFHENRDRMILALPADHDLSDTPSFERAIRHAGIPASDGHIVAFGTDPLRPDTGFGYIQVGKNHSEFFDVETFHEKPDQATATEYLKTGGFYWNTGIFMARADAIIDAFREHEPGLLEHCSSALQEADFDADYVRLHAPSYNRCKNVSFDHAIMEFLKDAKCVPLDSDWRDVGSWQAIADMFPGDESGNVVNGDVVLHDTRNSFAQSTDGVCLSLIGLNDVVAVATEDATLVVPKNRSQDVSQIVGQLLSEGRPEAVFSRRVRCPWGWYERLATGAMYRIKLLSIKPAARLSLQSHVKRAEHWVVVSGAVTVTIDNKTVELSENESAFIPAGARHRVENHCKTAAHLVEVQYGADIREDDLVRYEDDYGRTCTGQIKDASS